MINKLKKIIKSDLLIPEKNVSNDKENVSSGLTDNFINILKLSKEILMEYKED